MATDTRTALLGIEKTDPLNTIAEDMARIALAMDKIDVFLKTNIDNIAGKAAEDHDHEIEDVTGLQDALNQLAQDISNVAGDLADLGDTDTSDATQGMLLQYLNSKWTSVVAKASFFGIDPINDLAANNVQEAIAELVAAVTALAAAASAPPNISVVETSNPAFQFAAETKYAFVEVIGGGGGGGASNSSSETVAGAGSGGGGGGYAAKFIDVSGLDPKEAVIMIGGGGAGGVSGSSSPSDGGSSSYSDGTNTITGGGANGGINAVHAAGPYCEEGGSGGAGSGGDINLEGGDGGPAYSSGDNVDGFHIAMAGFGGMTQYAGSHKSPATRSSSATQASARNGKSFGGGGTGSASVHDGLSRDGGDGSDGVVIIWEYQ